MRDDFYSHLYDDVVGGLGNPKKSDSEQAFIDRVVSGMANGSIPRQAVPKDVMEARLIYKDKIEPLRDRRSQSLRKAMEYLIDSLLYGEDGSNIDPLLSQSFKLGNGTEKLLAAWTPADYRASSTKRQKEAGDQVVSADEFDAVAERFADLMEKRGVRETGGLFDGTGEAKAVA